MWDIHQHTVMAAETEDWELALEETLGITVDQLHLDLATYVHGLLQDYSQGNEPLPQRTTHGRVPLST